MISSLHFHTTPVCVCVQIDKKILGGFVLEFEDRLVDMSRAKKLEEYNNTVARLEGDLL